LTASHVLDAMADTNVNGLDREKLHAPLMSYLETLKPVSAARISHSNKHTVNLVGEKYSGLVNPLSYMVDWG
jgi:hypothetical protein